MDPIVHVVLALRLHKVLPALGCKQSEDKVVLAIRVVLDCDSIGQRDDTIGSEVGDPWRDDDAPFYHLVVGIVSCRNAVAYHESPT